MQIRRTPIEKSGIDIAIEDVLSEMKGFTADQDEYATMVDQLTKLHALKMCEKPAPMRVSPDALVVTVGNLLGVAMILQYERFHVVTSKAMLFVTKLR